MIERRAFREASAEGSRLSGYAAVFRSASLPLPSPRGEFVETIEQIRLIEVVHVRAQAACPQLRSGSLQQLKELRHRWNVKFLQRLVHHVSCHGGHAG